ncbi:hypothetical protein K439DRAFT_1372903 [Ramaria rubella]|nr:hypothetical protein K439DRAFT_1372903 [Ramaria rubella]
MHTSTPTTKTRVPEVHEEPKQQPAEWGNNFWVTLVDPQSQAQFYACPSTGETTWDAPIGNFVLPPSTDGEWWELRDETRGGIPYYYHTKSGDTTWEKPDGFVIPLGVIQVRGDSRRALPVINDHFAKLNVQNTTLGRKLSQSTRRHSQLFPTQTQTQHSYSTPTKSHGTQAPSSRSARRTTHTSPPSIISEHSEELSGSGGERSSKDKGKQKEKDKDKDKDRDRDRDRPEEPRKSSGSHTPNASRTRPHIPPTAQSLTAAVELISSSATAGANNDARSTVTPPRINGNASAPEHSAARKSSSRSPERRRARTPRSSDIDGGTGSVPSSPVSASRSYPPLTNLRSYSTTNLNIPLNGNSATLAQKSPRRPIPAAPSSETGFWRTRRNTNQSTGPVNIGMPVLDPEATRHMSPVKRDAQGVPVGKPIQVTTRRLSTGEHPLLPRDLVSEIQQFAQSDFARRYFSTHREGIIFRRRVPVERMMMWQKTPLTSPLLVMNKSLHRDAVKVFKVIQRIMGDRDRDKNSVRHTDSASSLHAAAATSTNALLEEERWLLGEGVTHGEMRDEIYCQVIKQLSGNSNTESKFRGWQLLCVLVVTFPPSKNFEPYVRSFMQQCTTQAEGRIDVMAKFCLHRLTAIAKKGPRGKAPTIAEIENASDAAFNPSTFGESLDAIYRLQERTYASLKVPVILPFLADGILALGGTKQEGIFRVPGDADTVSELRLRIDKGIYTLDGIDDPNVPASLFKLWLRELLDPPVPQELYNECIGCADDPAQVVAMVGRLPTIHRRVMLFVISFLQLFLEEKVLSVTKMTGANLALVMAPNMLRCTSESMSVVFTNAQFEHRFVYNLLIHLRCGEVDPDYIPEHGKGAIPTPVSGRKSHQKSRRPKA